MTRKGSSSRGVPMQRTASSGFSPLPTVALACSPSRRLWALSCFVLVASLLLAGASLMLQSPHDGALSLVSHFSRGSPALSDIQANGSSDSGGSENLRLKDPEIPDLGAEGKGRSDGDEESDTGDSAEEEGDTEESLGKGSGATEEAPEQSSSPGEEGDVGTDEEDASEPYADSQGKTSAGEAQRAGKVSGASPSPDRAHLESPGPERSAASEMSECFRGAPQERLRVYMYELPRKFNFGLFQRGPSWNWSDTAGGDPVNEKPWGQVKGEEGALPPKWPWDGRTHPTAKQHSMEYFIVADLLLPPAMRNPNVTATRVLDPEEADVFLVPVFASQLVNLYRRRHYPVFAGLGEELAALLSSSPWWKRSGGRDHVIPLHHPCALDSVRDWMSGAMFIVVDFARFHPAAANPSKDIVQPYNQLVQLFPRAQEEAVTTRKGRGRGRSPFQRRTTLLYFQGSVAGRPVRRKVMEALQGFPDVHVADIKATVDTVKETEAGMRSSKFCVHIVGDTPSASRLFHAIVSACIPVIISDAIDLPMESAINYARFSLFFREQDAVKRGAVVEKLRSVGEQQWMGMWEALHEVQHHFLFQVPSAPEDAVDMMWREVQRRRPWVRLSMHRDRRLTIPDWWDHEDLSDGFTLRRTAHRNKTGNSS